MIIRAFFHSLMAWLKPAWAMGNSTPSKGAYEYLGRPLAQPFPARGEDDFPRQCQEDQSEPVGSLQGPAETPSTASTSEGSLPSTSPLRESPIAVAIVEDQPSVRENLAKLINGSPGFRCVAACVDAKEALKVIPAIKPEIVLMDINLPGGRNGIQCTFRLCELLPDIQIIMLTIEEDAERVFDSMKAGATGYLVKHSSPREILEALTEVHRGGAPMSSLIARKVVTAFRQRPPESVPDAVLSERQEEVLKMLAQGMHNKEIAERLGISLGVVNNHVQKVYKKLHVRSRAEVVIRLNE
jgi:DNA-binding NarL/FixJ family response regulator